MKCEKCGKNEANCYYRSNINGNITESHLCSACAGEMERENNYFGNFFAETNRFFDDMFSGFFGGRRGLMGGGLGLAMPMLFPRIDIRLDDGSCGTCAAPSEEKTNTDPEMEKKRTRNMLRQQMDEAIAKENFEKAAELRDKIRELDKK